MAETIKPRTKAGLQLPEGSVDPRNYVGDPDSGSFVDWDTEFVSKGMTPPAEANEHGTPSVWRGRATGFGRAPGEKFAKGSSGLATPGSHEMMEPAHPFYTRDVGEDAGGMQGGYERGVTGEDPYLGSGAATGARPPAPATSGAPAPMDVPPTMGDQVDARPMPFAAQLSPMMGRMEVDERVPAPADIPPAKMAGDGPRVAGAAAKKDAITGKMSDIPWIDWEGDLVALMSSSKGRGHGRPDFEYGKDDKGAEEAKGEMNGTEKSFGFGDLMKGLEAIYARVEEPLSKAKYKSRKRVGGKWVYTYDKPKKQGGGSSDQQFPLIEAPQPGETKSRTARRFATYKEEQKRRKEQAKKKFDLETRDQLLPKSPGVAELKSDSKAAQQFADKALRTFTALSAAAAKGDKAAQRTIGGKLHGAMRTVGHDLAAAGRADLAEGLRKQLADKPRPAGDRGSHQQLVSQHSSNLYAGIQEGKKKARKAGLSTSERDPGEKRIGGRKQGGTKADRKKYEATARNASDALLNAYSAMGGERAKAARAELDRRAKKSEEAMGYHNALRKGGMPDFIKEKIDKRESKEDEEDEKHGKGLNPKEAQRIKKLPPALQKKAKEKARAEKSLGYAPLVERDQFGRELAKGLYAFRHKADDAALPDDYLYDYLCAFVHEAVEHESRENQHKPMSAKDQLMVIAKGVMGELVMALPSNPNLMRACTKYSCTVDTIAQLIVEKGLHRPAADSDWTDDMQSIMAMGGEAMAYSLDAQTPDIDPYGRPGVRLAPRPADDVSGLVKSDSVDPFASIRARESARVRALWSQASPTVEGASVAADCPVHGGRDMTKSMQVWNPMQPCTCNGEPNPHG